MSANQHFPPHPVLEAHYASADRKQVFLRSLFDNSAAHYERVASWGFFGTGDWYRRQALRRGGLRAGLRVADIASGTGITARAAVAIVGDPKLITCVDSSRAMLRESQRQLSTSHIQCVADALALRDAEFDFLVMGFALRHVENLLSAFREFYRVLRPGGRVLILDISKPESRAGKLLLRFYFRDFMPRFTQFVTRSQEARYLMEYYWETLDQMVPPNTVLEALVSAGFVTPSRYVDAAIFSEYRAVKA